MDALILENFKCFRDFELPVAPLTVLTGFNGGGKSTALQSLMLLGQTLRLGSNGDRLILNGPLTSLGRVGDIIAHHADGASMRLGLRSDERVSSWAFRPHGEGEDRYLRVEGSPALIWPEATPLSAEAQRLRDTIFISAVRLGMVEAFPYPDGANLPQGDVGQRGEYAAYWAARTADDRVDAQRRCPGDETETARGQVDAWLSAIFPEMTVSASALRDVSLYSARFRKGRGNEMRPANTGYGISYVFPLIVSLLNAAAGTIVIIDSPEAHLHPRAQSIMGRFLVRMAAAGIQLFVETHSDHLLSGMRLGVREQLLHPEKMLVNFFQGTGGSSGNPDVVTLRVDAAGAISAWPEGFFDQAERDLATLSGWN